MKLYKPDSDPAGEASRRRDLTCLLEQPSYRELRACLSCSLPCPCSGSPTCTCACGPDCASAPAQMSSEGDRYPIEPKILALVFSFKCLRVCPPFWSCEGHYYPDGSLRRVPQLWFYARSLVYPRLIGDMLAYSYFKKRIANPWHICVSYSESDLDTGFSLEPDVKMIDRLVLEELQNDAAALSTVLVPDARAFAEDYLARFSSER